MRIFSFLHAEKQKPVRSKFRVSYSSKEGGTHQVYVHARDEEHAKKEFISYYASPGDEVTDIVEDEV